MSVDTIQPHGAGRKSRAQDQARNDAPPPTGREGRILPVEVKSGAGGSLRSLHLMFATYPSCPEGMVPYSGTYARVPEQHLTFLPLYYAAHVGDPRPDLA